LTHYETVPENAINARKQAHIHKYLREVIWMILWMGLQGLILGKFLKGCIFLHSRHIWAVFKNRGNNF